MRASAPRAFLPAIVVLGLVAVVAIAATGSTRGGSDETRRPSDIVLDTFFTFALLALIPAAAILIYGLMQRRAIAQEVASGKYRRNRRAPVVPHPAQRRSRSLYYFRPRRFGLLRIRGERPHSGAGTGAAEARATRCGRSVRARARVDPAAGGACAHRGRDRRLRRRETAAGAVVRRRTRASWPREAADVLDESLDDLRAEPDARRAVIAAYARLERTFAASGLARARTGDGRGARQPDPRRARGGQPARQAARRPLRLGEVLAPPRRRVHEGRGDRRPRADQGRAPRRGADGGWRSGCAMLAERTATS